MCNLNSICNEVKADFRELGIPYSKNIDLKWGSKRMTKALGLCERVKGSKKFTIKVAPILDGNDEIVKEVLAHELIHTVSGCFNHGEHFKRMGEVAARKGYHVSRLTRLPDDFKPAYKRNDIVIKCVDCGHEYHFSRECKTTRAVDRYPDGCRCSICHGKVVRV